MKKLFRLQEENKHPDRVVEGIKHEIRKYLKRERGKKLPEEFHFWEFACRFGKSAEDAVNIHQNKLFPHLDTAHQQKWEQCYIEIIAHPSKKAAVTPKE